MRSRSCSNRTYVLYFDFIHIAIHNRAVTHRNIMILLHYITETLSEEKPDEVIINVGTNALRKDDACKIAADIINIVHTCRQYGVNKVYVSAITPRPGLLSKIKQVNDILSVKSSLYDYAFIANSTISMSHLYKDNVHLSDEASRILCKNFLRAVNKGY